MRGPAGRSAGSAPRAALGAALLALAVALPGAAAAQGAEELEALRRAIDEHRERVAAFEREGRALVDGVEEMDRASEALARDAERARRDGESARKRLVELGAEARVLERRQTATREALSVRAVALYKAGEPGPLRILFAAESLPDLLHRLEVLRVLLVRDRELILRYRRQGDEIEAARASMQGAARDRDHAAARLEARNREIARERAAKRVILRELRQNRTRERTALYELEAAAKVLEETLARLGGAPRDRFDAAAVPFASLRGRLEPPVAGEVVAGFGRVVDPEFQTETFRKGIDLAAEEGTRVRAVADGAVRYAGWFRGYGKIVILDHGEGYFTVSGHLADAGVEVGARVAAGDPIGTVGETGSLSGPRLYFEIRHGGEPLDPAEWLHDG